MPEHTRTGTGVPARAFDWLEQDVLPAGARGDGRRDGEIGQAVAVGVALAHIAPAVAEERIGAAHQVTEKIFDGVTVITVALLHRG